MTRPTLSIIHPDFDDIVTQLRDSLADKDTWKALLAVDTGTILIEAVAASATMLMTAIQNSAEESNTDTAKLASSLKAISRTLGVRLQRKSPGEVDVTITLPSALGTQYLIPPYSSFSGAGVSLFNREAILIPAGDTTVTATLYEGKLKTFNAQSTGQPLQILTVDVPGFTISNDDVLVSVDSAPLQVVQDGLWHYPVVAGPVEVVQDRTLPTGELELVFGNSLFGFLPPSTATISVTYALTNGAQGNVINFAGNAISYTMDNTLQVVADTPIANGTNEPDAEIYRTSPLLYASYNRAVSLIDHDAVALQYPSVADARFFGQNLIAPTVKDYMNVVYVYVLQKDGTQLTVGEYADFKEWLLPRAMPLDYVRKTATTIPIDVEANVFIKNNGDAELVRANVQAAIEALFEPSVGFLGRNLYLSDIYDAIHDADPFIDYLQLVSPTTDAICQIEAPIIISLAGVANGGSLIPATTYEYVVTALNSNGETFASATVNLLLPVSTDCIDVTWSEVPGATGYNVYGRLAGGVGKLTASPVPAGTLTWQDNGSVTPGAAANQVNSSGLYYVTLNSTTINLDFTSRK